MAGPVPLSKLQVGCASLERSYELPHLLIGQPTPPTTLVSYVDAGVPYRCVSGIARQRTTKKITVTLPIEDTEAVERLAAAGEVESVSRYVTEAVAFRRAREDGLAVLERRFGKPAPEAWTGPETWLRVG
jgi:Arc/MetJ-type ribon-helix-helix transcriptional regulator